MNKSWRPRILKIALFVVVGTAVITSAVMALWNVLIPTLFTGVPAISFLQALGLLVLSRVLFGGFRRGGPGRTMRHRMTQLTDEERAQLMASGGYCRGRRGFAATDAKADVPAA